SEAHRGPLVHGDFQRAPNVTWLRPPWLRYSSQSAWRRIITRPSPPEDASSSDFGSALGATERGSKATPASDTVTPARPPWGSAVTSSTSPIGCASAPAPPWTITFASTSLRHSTRRSTRAGGTPRSRHAASSQLDARRTSSPSARTVSSSADDDPPSALARGSDERSLLGIRDAREHRDQLVDAGRLEAHGDGRGLVHHQHHLAAALVDFLGARNERADADRGEELEGGEVHDHRLFRCAGELDELRGDRLGTRHVEAAGDHDAAQVRADVDVADGHRSLLGGAGGQGIAGAQLTLSRAGALDRAACAVPRAPVGARRSSGTACAVTDPSAFPSGGSHGPVLRRDRHSRSPSQPGYVQAHVRGMGQSPAAPRRSLLFRLDQRRCTARKGHVVSAGRAAEGRRSDCARLGGVPKQGGSRPHQQGGHGRPAAQGVDGSREDAFRRQAHVLGRLRVHHRARGGPLGARGYRARFGRMTNDGAPEETAMPGWYRKPNRFIPAIDCDDPAAAATPVTAAARKSAPHPLLRSTPCSTLAGKAGGGTRVVGTYSNGVVLLSFLVAVLASYTALDLASRITASTGAGAAAWLLGGAFAMGTGIWSMHFIGMLAFTLPIATAYHIGITLASMAIAIVVSGFALYTVSRDSLSLRSLALGGVLMGIGISAMHYTGMAAMEVEPGIRYDRLLFAASIVIAIAASTAALWISFQLRSDARRRVYARLAGAVVMGGAIVGMHYTGMAAAKFDANTICTAATLTNNGWMAPTLAVVTFLILCGTLSLSLLDARMESRQAQMARSLHAANEKLQHLVLHDALTKLPNRLLLEERVQQAVDECRAGETHCAVLFVDLDRFKTLNDSLGHFAG